MGKTLYLECYSGISGDMTAAALLDLGADKEVLDCALKSLKVQGFSTNIRRVKKSGIDACDFDVVLDAEHDNHDHDMEYLHGKGHHHGHSHGGDHSHEHHHHDHSHAGEDHHVHAHEHRGMKEIRQIIEEADMTKRAKELALKIFGVLAEAEAQAHCVSVEEVHFHEVGAVDSIVDILSIAICVDNLDITEVIVPELYEGRGTVRCQHGILPIPVPAVANIVKNNGLKLHITEVQGELVTPTGAAVAAALRTSDKLPMHFSVLKTGIGAGKRRYECPGILRAMLIQEEVSEEKICKLETNIDDCSGEVLGYVMERLLEAGAREVHYIPAFMKKNRPGWILVVLCMEKDRKTMEQIIFRETTTIGIRRQNMERTVLKREQKMVGTAFGEAEVNVCRDGTDEYFYPEYESVAALSRRTGVPFKEVYQQAAEAAKKEIKQNEDRGI